MKTKILFFTQLLMIVGCSKDPVNEISLQTRGGLKYEINQTTPFSGPTFMTHENGQISFKGNYKDGIKDGSFEEFYDNGQLKKSVLYGEGIESGESVFFSENGDSIFYQNFDNDSSFIKDILYFTESDYWKVKSVYVFVTNEFRQVLEDPVNDKYLKSVKDGRLYLYEDFKIIFQDLILELGGIDPFTNSKLIISEKSLDVEIVDEYGEKDKLTLQYDINFENSLFIISELDENEEKYKIKLSKNPDFDSFEIILELNDIDPSFDEQFSIGIIFSKID